MGHRKEPALQPGDQDSEVIIVHIRQCDLADAMLGPYHARLEEVSEEVEGCGQGRLTKLEAVDAVLEVDGESLVDAVPKPK